MKSLANRAIIWGCVSAKTHATVSVPTFVVCLMLTERETEHERLAVFGLSVCVCEVVLKGGLCVSVKGQEEGW